ncbi:MAG: PD40 domain-containing protein [Candidatus Krumholzibacteriota bacterium]|nr:PD40 domain-containing protein [Candidatus Krumholzibacteriota bacterium]
MPKRLLLALLILLPSRPVAGQTDIYLRTETTGRGRIPIVVRDVAPGGEALRTVADLVSRTLEKDLRYSGFFDPVRVSGGPDSLPDGRTAAAIFEGALLPDGESLALEARLLDFSSRAVIFSKIYRFERTAARLAAHNVSDAILYFLVGERGIATTRLLYCRREGEAKTLYAIDYDGHGEKAYTKEEIVVSPLWLDDARFVYTSYRRGNPDLYLVDLRRGKRRVISHRVGINLAGDYVGESDELVATLSVAGNSEIFVLGSDGAIRRRITRNRAIDVSPTWAPNGRELAFVSDRTGFPQVYVCDAFGGNVRRLSESGSYNVSPAWSPHGDAIAYVSRDGWRYRLKLVSPDGLAEEIIHEDDYSYEDPSWAPDGRHIAATVRYGGVPWIVIIDVDSGEKRLLVRGESPAWSPLPPGED